MPNPLLTSDLDTFADTSPQIIVPTPRSNPWRSREKSRGRWGLLLALLGVTFAAAAAASMAAGDSRDFYATLDKPFFAPPGWIFGPVWSVLYVLMPVAVWLAARSVRNVGHTRNGRRRSAAAVASPVSERQLLFAYAIQLMFNAAWTPLFFTVRSGLLAGIAVVLLLGSVLYVATLVRRVNTRAWSLWLPSVLWVSFATLLSFVTWAMNPSLL
jgi:tryptophan-rich sensory protein